MNGTEREMSAMQGFYDVVRANEVWQTPVSAAETPVSSTIRIQAQKRISWITQRREEQYNYSSLCFIVF